MTTTPKPKLLTRAEILATQDRDTEIVDVPEWGGAVTVRPLSGTERGQFEEASVKYRRTDAGGLEIESVETVHQRARLVSLSVIDAEGKRLFKDADVLALGDKSAAALERISQVAQRISMLTIAAQEALKTGLKADQNGSSGSESPETSDTSP